MRCLSLLVASLGAASALRVALCQFEVGTDKEANIATARAEIAAAAADGAKLVVLPEIWNGPYATTKFAAYAEPVPSVGSGPGGAVTWGDSGSGGGYEGGRDRREARTADGR